MDGRAVDQRALHRLRRVMSADLDAAETAAIRDLLRSAFEQDDDGFTESDWDHAFGGVHFILEVGGEIVAHAAVVEREIQVGGRALRTGYVEAVATAPAQQGHGYGTAVMAAATSHVRERFELGALGTSLFRFYERLGWQRWRGKSAVRAPDGLRPTPDEDGFIMVLSTPTTSGPLDADAAITCEWRAGDVW